MDRIGSRAIPTLVALAVAAWLFGLPTAALAQSGGPAPVKPLSGLGYGFLGLGAVSWDGESDGTWHAGGGGEAVFRDAFGMDKIPIKLIFRPRRKEQDR